MRRWSGFTAVTILIVGSLASWLRLSVAARDTLWAEDARDFLGDAVRDGPIAALFTPYAGYLHTVPRIIAGVTEQVAPVDAWAMAMAGASCVVVGGVAALVFICARDSVPWGPARVILASITVLIPHAPHEVLGNTANLHWYFLWLMPWLLLYRPRSRVGAWLLGCVTLLAALTEIQMVLFLPLLLWKWRDRRRLPVRILYLVGIGIQIATTLIAPRGASQGAPIGFVSLVDGYLINAVMTVWFSSAPAIGHLLTTFGSLSGVVLLLPFFAAAAWGWWRGSPVQRVTILTLLLGSAVLYATAVEVSPGTFYDYASLPLSDRADPWLARYGVVPSMFLLALVPLAVGASRRRHRSGVAFRAVPGAAVGSTPTPATAQTPTPTPTPTRRRRRVIVSSVVLLALLVLMLVQFSPRSTRRDDGPLWQPQVVAARTVCASEPPTHVVALAGAPASEWKVDLPCSRLDAPPGR
ncbi:hypothetical protein GCM10022381_39490 [Leifsonia kafniensis]|uniref:DUF2029 domain-containing protein n=1 Tax=Leifsonia kafniensis TaxID=475957 RepID=A0ABP7L422_9MICO